MTQEIIIILLLIALFYYYQKSRTQPAFLGRDKDETNQTLVSFLRDQLNSNSLEELKTKLGGKTLDELLEENQDYETEVDTLTRAKNSLEKDLLAQSNGFQNRLREKDRETKKLKEDLKSETQRADKIQEKLNSEKQISKGNVQRVNLLTKQILELEEDLKTYRESGSEWTNKKKELEQRIQDLEQKLTKIPVNQGGQVEKLKEKLNFYIDNLKTKEGIIEEYKKKLGNQATTLKELQVANQAWAQKQAEHDKQAQELFRLKNQQKAVQQLIAKQKYSVGRV